MEGKQQNLTTLQQTMTAEINAVKTEIRKKEEKILETTAQEVQEIEAKAARKVKIIDAETSNLVQQKQRLIDLEKQETERQVNAILQEIEIAKAEKDKTIMNIIAESNAKVQRYLAAARAKAKKTKAASVQAAFDQFVTNLSFTAKELNALHWTDFIASHKGDLHIDMQKPEALSLEGQEESYYDTLDATRL